jgi:hypothetical protein
VGGAENGGGRGDFALCGARVFRSVRGATNGLPLDRKKLLKKFYQNF